MERTKLPSGGWLKALSGPAAEIEQALATLTAGATRLTTALDRHTTAVAWIEAAGGSKSFLTVQALLRAR